MKALQISDKTARELYKQKPDLRQVLIESFGDKFFSEKITDRIKTFDDACRECGTSEEEFNKKWLNIGLDPDDIGYKKAKIVVKALNEGKEPNYNDPNQRKYEMWVDLGGGGVAYDDFDYWYSGSYVGPRLVFLDPEMPKYAFNQFRDIFELFYKP